MKLTILGYWGGFPFNGDGTTSFLLESDGFSLLLDAGSGSLLALEEHLNPVDLDAVLLTHYHHDHIADLGVLQYYRQLMPKPEQPVLPIYGHMEDTFHFEELTLAGVSQGIGYKETDQVTIGPFSVTFLRTVHPVPCFAVRLVERETGKILVFTADSGYLSALADFAKDADVLITDTYFLEGHENHHAHLTSKETGEIAVAAGVKKLILSHLRQDIELPLLKEQVMAIVGGDIPVILAEKHLEMII